MYALEGRTSLSGTCFPGKHFSMAWVLSLGYEALKSASPGNTFRTVCYCNNKSRYLESTLMVSRFPNTCFCCYRRFFHGDFASVRLSRISRVKVSSSVDSSSRLVRESSYIFWCVCRKSQDDDSMIASQDDRWSTYDLLRPNDDGTIHYVPSKHLRDFSRPNRPVDSQARFQ